MMTRMVAATELALEYAEAIAIRVHQQREVTDITCR
jgi:hypothetical protein